MANKTVNLKIFSDTIDEKAKSQVFTFAKLPAFVYEKIRIMPDCHAGAGCVIGFTSTMTDKVIPNVIGVDIGCGVRVEKLNVKYCDFADFDTYVRQTIPSGMIVNDSTSDTARRYIDKLFCKNSLKNKERLESSLGTLGGGNHFIEIEKSENDGFLYIVVHTGSRNLGKQVAEYYQRLAIKRLKTESKEEETEKKETVERLKKEGRQTEIEAHLKTIREKYRNCSDIPDDLCYLEGQDLRDYMHDMRICQEFAKKNRKTITQKILQFFEKRYSAVSVESFESVHNYIDDSNMIRKGAISAHTGQKVIIPLNMRDGSIIGFGKGNKDWNESAPHGAGRILSRSEAKKLLTVEEFQREMEGIYTTTADSSTLDESPMAYKPIEEILKYVGDTIDIDEIIKPVYNFKATE